MNTSKDLRITMAGYELRLGWLYLLGQQLLLPQLLAFFNARLTAPLSSEKLNFLFFCINFVCILGIYIKHVRSHEISALSRESIASI